MKYLCRKSCFVNGQIYLKDEVRELPDSMVKPEKNWQLVGGEPVVEPTSDATEKPPETSEPPVHKHHYRKDGTCACGAVLSLAAMKRRERKAKKAQS